MVVRKGFDQDDMIDGGERTSSFAEKLEDEAREACGLEQGVSRCKDPGEAVLWVGIIECRMQDHADD